MISISTSKSTRNMLSFNKGENTRKTFLELEKSLKFTAENHETDIFTILNILSKDSYQGLREWYRELAERWWKPQAPKFEGDDRESAENMISVLPIIVTGARPNEIIIGTKTQSLNAIMRIHDVVVPPKTQALDNIRAFDDLWKRFLNKLGSIKYFESLTKIEREMWLEYYQSDRDLYLEDVDDLYVEILSFGSSDFLKLPEGILEQLGESETIFSMRDVVDTFPKKPGSEGLKGRHTLVFRRGIWKVSTIYREVEYFDGPTIDISKGKILKSSKKSDGKIISTFDSFAEKYTSLRGKYTIEKKQTIAFSFSSKLNSTTWTLNPIIFQIDIT